MLQDKREENCSVGVGSREEGSDEGGRRRERKSKN